MTASPGRLSTGTLSPVSIDSSTAERALGDDAVDRDLLAGPDPHQVADDDVVERYVDLRRRRGARGRSPGARPTSARIEAAVRFFAFSSSQRPIRIRAMTISAVSK